MAVGKGPDIPEYNDDPLLQWSVAMFVASLLLWVGSGFAVIILATVENSKSKHTHFNVLIHLFYSYFQIFPLSGGLKRMLTIV